MENASQDGQKLLFLFLFQLLLQVLLLFLDFSYIPVSATVSAMLDRREVGRIMINKGGVMAKGRRTSQPFNVHPANIIKMILRIFELMKFECRQNMIWYNMIHDVILDLISDSIPKYFYIFLF